MKEKESLYRSRCRELGSFSEWRPGRQLVWRGVMLSLILFWGAVLWLLIDWAFR